MNATLEKPRVEKPPVPASETTRLQVLKDYQILDTPDEQDFDDITLLASAICKTPIALISLIDEKRQWFKSRVGITATETPREDAFCAHGIVQTGVFEVRDAREDERFADNPMVKGGPNIRFYAGAPLLSPEGEALGMLCVKDRVPHQLDAEQKNALQALSRQVVAQLELRKKIRQLGETIELQRRAETMLEQTHEKLVESSRKAGMAEVASSVLHNVGNVLNSVNVSSSLIAEKMQASKVSNLPKVVALIRENETDIAKFFASEDGKELLDYVETLASHLVEEQDEVLHEVGSLVSNILHIREIVAMQQNYATASGLREKVIVNDLVEDALTMTRDAMTRHNVRVECDFAHTPPLLTEKHKILQILVNLIRNAKQACTDTGLEDKLVRISVARNDGHIVVSVADNGVGIVAENLTRIFNHGFTTRPGGHGFGLHSSGLAAQELGGKLEAASPGVGRGATFKLELPLKKEAR